MRYVVLCVFMFMMCVPLAVAEQSISGRVVGADGTARSAISLSLFAVDCCESLPIASIQTDSEGEFQWSGTLPTGTQILALRSSIAGRNSPQVAGIPEVVLIPINANGDPVAGINIVATPTTSIAAVLPVTRLNVLVFNADNNTSVFVKPEDSREFVLSNVRIVDDIAWIKVVTSSCNGMTKFIPVSINRSGGEVPNSINIGAIELDHCVARSGGDVSVSITGGNSLTDLRSDCRGAAVYLIKSDMSSIVRAVPDVGGQHLWKANLESGLHYVFVGDRKSIEFIAALVREAGDGVVIPQNVPRIVCGGPGGEMGVRMTSVEVDPVDVRSAWVDVVVGLSAGQLGVP
jgi:hypothetical protein